MTKNSPSTSFHLVQLLEKALHILGKKMMKLTVKLRKLKFSLSKLLQTHCLKEKSDNVLLVLLIH